MTYIFFWSWKKMHILFYVECLVNVYYVQLVNWGRYWVFLYPCCFLTSFIKHWKKNVEVPNYNYVPVYFSPHFYQFLHHVYGSSLVWSPYSGWLPGGSVVQNPPTMQEAYVQPQGLEYLLEKKMAIFTPVFLPGKSHEQRSLVGYRPWGCKRVGHVLATKEQQNP